MDDVWIDDERGAVFMFPMAVLSGDADLAGEEDADGNVIADPAPQLRRCRELLAATVREANQYWTAWRRKSDRHSDRTAVAERRAQRSVPLWERAEVQEVL